MHKVNQSYTFITQSLKVQFDKHTTCLSKQQCTTLHMM